jgi:hypothetical protein
MPLTATTGCLLTHLFAVTVFLNQDPRMKILLLLKANEVIVWIWPILPVVCSVSNETNKRDDLKTLASIREAILKRQLFSKRKVRI